MHAIMYILFPYCGRVRLLLFLGDKLTIESRYLHVVAVYSLNVNFMGMPCNWGVLLKFQYPGQRLTV